MKRLLFTLALLTTVSLQAEDWPQFRGPRGDGIAPDAKLPGKLDAQSVAWSVDVPGQGVSSPIIVGDLVFVTSASGPKHEQLRVFCFRLADGTLRWERRFWATGRTMTHEKISPATPTPASDGRCVYALFSSNDCFALDLEGNLLWYRGLGRDYPNANNSLGMASSLVITPDALITQLESESESFAAGLDPRTGANRWKMDRPRKSNWASPVLIAGPDGKPVVLLQSSQGVAAVESATGRILWKYEDKASVVPSTTASNGRLYVPSQGLTVLEPSAGGPPKQVWRSGQLRPGTPSPVVLGERVFALNDGGILTCGDTADGKRLWQLRLKGPFSATPVVAGGLLYCVNELGLVQVVNPAAAEGEIVSDLDLGRSVIGTPAIAANSLFVRGDGKLWRIGRSSAL